MVWIEYGDARYFEYPWKADLIFVDPPQLIGKNNVYDLKESGLFTYFTNGWIRNAVKYLNDDGILAVVCRPEYQYDYEQLLRQRLIYKQTVIWNYAFGTYTKKRFVISHNPILIYGMSKNKFDWRACAIESQRQSSGDRRADHRGRTPGDVWSDVWDIPRMPGNQKQRVSGLPQLPVKLVLRFLKAYKATKVIDMMTGSGTIPALCKYLKIPCIGTDIDEDLLKLAKERLRINDVSLLV